ncbi:hypothetical protein DL93DRAFT_806315 [Clavulina sp. PMI_390]|nr:hypothetical protein DL93DRAFT_806315 [Clavulina sp. PMI_390]
MLIIDTSVNYSLCSSTSLYNFLVICSLTSMVRQPYSYLVPVPLTRLPPRTLAGRKRSSNLLRSLVALPFVSISCLPSFASKVLTSHRPARRFGSHDQGQEKIIEWTTEHRCHTGCRRLGLSEFKNIA